MCLLFRESEYTSTQNNVYYYHSTYPTDEQLERGHVLRTDGRAGPGTHVVELLDDYAAF